MYLGKDILVILEKVSFLILTKGSCHVPNPGIVAEVSFYKTWDLVKFKTISIFKTSVKSLFWLAGQLKILKLIFKTWRK